MSVIIVIVRLLLAAILGGLVGQEREYKHRPAGLRTHILVCIGSALVMLTSEYLFNTYKHQTNIDPARLGAQVISGIGFIGAGTIIKQGNSVKGLTTAASLWAVACVGIAVGIGFYQGAVAGALIIYLTLLLLGKYGKLMHKKSDDLVINVELENTPGKIGEIGIVFEKYNANIQNIKFLHNDDTPENDILMVFTLKLPHGMKHEKIITEVGYISGVHMVEVHACI